MSELCPALALFLRSCSGRKLHSLRKWTLSACLQSGQDLAGQLGRVFPLYGILLPGGLQGRRQLYVFRQARR